ncbi:MAG TPA: DUF362 domain-containing protein [Candidatus Kapabacteria bacterium]|nr:DUF362 domain-containing protein [Candidatus Kapabacteria bacterium]
MIDPSVVALTRGQAAYPNAVSNPGFHPSERYPEYPFDDLSPEPNDVYRQVRELLHKLGLDAANYGTAAWNPFGEIVRPGDNVVLKPNFVRHYHRLGKPLDCVITHASVLRPIMDYVWIALQGRGEIVVADSPQGDSNWDQLVERNGATSLFAYYTGHATSTLLIELRDLRKEWTVYKHGGVIWDRIRLKGDPHGYSTVALDADSEYTAMRNKNYYGADYDRDRTKQFHNETANRYNIANTILRADVFICVPKLKVHRKVGVTLNIKNLIGVNGEKNYLPHFVVGSPDKGGDEFSNDTFNNRIDRKLKDVLLWKHHSIGKYLYVAWHALDKFILRKFQPEQSFVKGDWWGNDTTWRSAVDLNKILLYCDREGRMHDTVQRRYLSIIDGIVGGEAEGPLTPDPVYSGVMLGGFDPLTVDIFASTVMGIDWHRLKMLIGAAHLGKYPLTDVEAGTYTVSSDVEHDFSLPLFHFRPPAGWVGHVEMEEDAPALDAQPAA